MATEKSSNEAAAPVTPASTAQTKLSAAHTALSVLASLGSPRLTVVLVLAAIGIVMVGTLAQVQMDIWEVVHDYFRAWVCWVELRLLFPVSLFPWAASTDWDSLPVRRFPYPGGALIGLGLVVNLAAVLVARFQVKARGARLAAGLLVLAAGVATTWIVIESGHNRSGVQGKPFVEWPTLWLLIQAVLVGLWLACVFGFVRAIRSSERQRIVAAELLGAGALVLSVLLGWIFVKGEAAVLTDSSLRILYQLIQGQVAALVLLAACAILYRDRAGSALLHGGVALLMFGEFFVSQFADEQQMTLAEKQTVNYTRDIRSVDLAVTTLRQDRDDVLAIPMEVSGEFTRFALGEGVQLDDLNFDIEVVEYYKNSQLEVATPEGPNLATQGVGLRYIVREAAPKSGVERGRTDRASAYVKLTSKEQEKDLGTYLVSQHFAETQPELNTVDFGGSRFGLGLRFKQSVKPYAMTLLDVRKDDYAGTAMARNYSSRVRLRDASRKVDFEAKIWMNNPLRYAGETFYQSGYNIDRNGREYSTLQVVKNTGWMLPYVSCMIVATGMVVQFLLALLRFLAGAQGGTREDPGSVTTRRAASMESGRRSEILVVSSVVLLAAAWLGSKALPVRSVDSQMDRERFGALPLMDEGRIKPFDTLARTSLRIISNRETFVDTEGRTQPAIGWLLDVISRPQAATEHRVFRIESMELQETLGLQPRKGARFAWKEFRPDSVRFRELVALAGQQDPQRRTFQQRKLMELAERVNCYRKLTEAFYPLPLPANPSPLPNGDNAEKAAEIDPAQQRLLKEIPRRNRVLQSMQLPLAVPAGSASQPWMAYATARNEAYANELLHRGTPAPATVQLAAVFQAYAQDNFQAFNQSVRDFEQLLADQSPAGLDLRLVRFEAYFNHVAPFYHMIPLYFLALVLTALSWLSAALSPRWSTWMRRAAFWLIVMTFAVHTLALGARVVISGRPPVTNLYSSAVFIGWGCVAIGLLMEIVFRLGIGAFVSSVAGIGTLIIANFLAADGDTIRVLQAVLDTQFWLTVHVLTITLGYSAMFLAGLLGLVSLAYMLGKTARISARALRGSGEVRQALGRELSASSSSDMERILDSMIYGSVCFAALFSLVGTILGGLWADDSWGRFWGWDPKENGALIIVLWTVLVLHARWSRLVEQRGMAILAVGGNIVTSWSWFGVNELGVGLHAYGSAEGVGRTLLIFWLTQLVAIGLALPPLWLISREKRLGR